MGFLISFFKLMFDALSFGGISFGVLIVCSFIVFPPSLKDERYQFCGFFGTFIALLSIAMMLLSGKYSNRPVSNRRSYTPWTWWRLEGR